MARTCAQCGSAIPSSIAFCGSCGAPAPIAAAPRDPGASASQRPLGTMIGIPAVGLPPPQNNSAPPAQQPSQAPAQNRNLGTMIGMPAVDLSAPPPAPTAGPSEIPRPAGDKQTLLGVAIPGIAPTQASSSPPADPRSAQGDFRTMLGVAIPGVAPTQSNPPNASAPPPYASSRPPKPMAALPPIVPAPPPLQLTAMPAPIVHSEKKGFPLAIVAGVIGAVVIVAGIATAILWKGSAPVLVQPRLGPQGDDELHLTCETCPDGTTVNVGGAKSTFVKTSADVKLTTPLHTGENPLDLSLDRPGVGRDEVVHAVVPVSFRIKTDITTLDSDTPAITVRVEAAPGSQVTVDGASVPLDAQGKGIHSIDVTTDVSGPADEGRQLEKKIPYVVAMKDAASKMSTEQGTVTASVPIPPLRVDSPTAVAVIDKDSFFLAGRTIPKGATITAGGKTLTVGDNGFFGDTFPATPNADTKLVVRASVANMAPRIVDLDVKRVDSLANEAKAFEARSPLGYDAIAQSFDAILGKEVALAGETIEARVQNHQTVFVLNDTLQCAHAPCVARVIVGAELTLRPHDQLRVYGTVGAAFVDKDGKHVPQVDAAFILHGLK